MKRFCLYKVLPGVCKTWEYKINIIPSFPDSEATVSSFEEVCSISSLSSLEGDSTIVFIESHLEKFAGPSNRMSAKRSCTP